MLSCCRRVGEVKLAFESVLKTRRMDGNESKRQTLVVVVEGGEDGEEDTDDSGRRDVRRKGGGRGKVKRWRFNVCVLWFGESRRVCGQGRRQATWLGGSDRFWLVENWYGGVAERG